MLDDAVALLNRFSLPQLLAARGSLANELARLEHQLAEVEQRIPTWERIVFFRDSPDETLAADLRARIEETRARYAVSVEQSEQAFARMYPESPPLEITCRAERVIATALGNPDVGRRPEHDLPLAEELEAIASRIVEVWVPGFHAGRLAAVLANDESRWHAASRAAGAPRGDRRTGWAPITPEELASRASAALQTEEFARVRAAVAGEAAHQAAVAEQLRRAREQVTALDRITPGKSASEQAVAALEAALGKEQRELMAATETFHHAVELALAAFPPMGVYLAALAAAGAIRTARPGAETVLSASGGVESRPAYAPRAIVLATLVQLRAALDRAFPGLSELVAVRRHHARALEQGPYREASAATAPQVQTQTGVDDDLMKELDRRGVRQLLVRGVAHASMLGSLARSRTGVQSQIGWSDRLAVWSTTPQEQIEDELRAREEWHGVMLSSVAQQARSVVAEAARQFPRHALASAVVAAHAAAASIRTNTRQSSSPIWCPEHGKADLLRALAAAREPLERGFGLQGDRQSLVQAVLVHLQRPAVPSPLQGNRPWLPLTWDLIVTAVAEALRPTEFVALQQQLQITQRHYEQARAGARQARDAVSFWDKLNVFTKSPEEHARDELDAQAEQMFKEISGTAMRANGLLDSALRVYPPAVVYYDLLTVVSAAGAIRAERRRGSTSTRVGKTTVRRTYYYCVLHGKERAEACLRGWTSALVRCFGPTPAAGEVLAGWVARELA